MRKWQTTTFFYNLRDLKEGNGGIALHIYNWNDTIDQEIILMKAAADRSCRFFVSPATKTQQFG